MGLRSKRRAGGYSATAGLPFDDRHLESRLVWIWTAARSGSTWLLRLLSHPLKLVDASNDPSDRLGFRPPRNWSGTLDALPVDTTFIANHLLPLPAGADYDERTWTPLTFSSALGLSRRPNYFFSEKYADVWRPELRRLMLVRFNGLIEGAADRFSVDDPLVLLKEVAGGHAAELVMSLFPGSRFIFLVRDGRDVVDSQTAAGQPGSWLPVGGSSSPAEHLDRLRRRCRAWVGDMKTIQRAYDAHPPALRRMVRYEELLADTEATLHALIDWLGLRRSGVWLERAVAVNSFDKVPAELKGPKKFFRAATPGGWRETMNATERSIVQETMDEQLRNLGYEA
jgi:hypothetical protein